MMARYRNKLPQLDGSLYLTDGGLETTLVFIDEVDLPCLAAFQLMRQTEGVERLRRYYMQYAAIAREHGAGFILESPTWRANRDWGNRLEFKEADLAQVNRKSIELMSAVREESGMAQPMVISGCVGPRGDGYDPGQVMSANEAEEYHAAQIKSFAESEADLATATTMTNVPEAIGIARAAKAADLPVVISFTVETDGGLPTGDTLEAAINQVDSATDSYPSYYMVNCAHPNHFIPVLSAGDSWHDRIRGIRANASTRSHAELDETTELDSGDHGDFGSRHVELKNRLKSLNVFGGCCGTDHRHVQEIARVCGKMF
jgi:S-methylmethionine-dependent homocysteine/selenocysteine methylase